MSVVGDSILPGFAVIKAKNFSYLSIARESVEGRNGLFREL